MILLKNLPLHKLFYYSISMSNQYITNSVYITEIGNQYIMNIVYITEIGNQYIMNSVYITEIGKPIYHEQCLYN